MVALKTAELAAVTDRPGQVLAIAGSIPAEGVRPNRDNFHRHRLDAAAAHVKLHDPAAAIEVLQELRRDSPEWLPQQHYARDILSDVIVRRRTLTPEMRELADFVSLPY